MSAAIALALAGTYMVTRLVGGSLEERFNNQLAEAARMTPDALVRRERKHLETMRGIASTAGVAPAAAAGDAAKLSILVEPLAATRDLCKTPTPAPKPAHIMPTI